jgi:hypothetical protein
MKIIPSICALLFVTAAIGAGCGSAEEFQVDVSDITPMESPAGAGVEPQVAPEEIAPTPQADAEEGADEEVAPENDHPVVIISQPLDGDLIKKELRYPIDVLKVIKTGDDRTAVYHFGGDEYFSQHPDVKIKTGDDRVAVKPLFELTPEQQQMLIDKFALKRLQNSDAIEKLKCLADGNGRESCED